MAPSLLPAALACALAALLVGCGGGGGDDSTTTPMTTTATPSTPPSNGTAFLVESLPMAQFDLELLPETRYTWDVLTEYVGNATEKIDLAAMYWDLLAGSKKGDQKNFTAEELKAFGADKGANLQTALLDAAGRGVKIRVLCGTGIAPPCVESIAELNKTHGNFEAQLYNATAWYGSGIMHMKFWIFDDNRAVLGSSNPDWLSLTQVKEMNVAFDGPPGLSVVGDLQTYFDRWWYWTGPDGPPTDSSVKKDVYSTPCWEKTDYEANTSCADPFPNETKSTFNYKTPMALKLNGDESGSFISCSPPAICDHAVSINPMYAEIPDGREWDGAALIHTIMSAKKTIGLEVMDYKPSSGYVTPEVSWPALSDALIAAVRRGVKVRMLVSHWYSNSPYWSKSGDNWKLNNVDEWIHYNLLKEEAAACTTRDCSDGSLEIGVFEVPGWDKEHDGEKSEFPLFSRVNHAKFIVTDDRFNIGTSNMDWGYFHTTAGTSFNSNHPGLRTTLQAAFDRDWNSAYNSPLQDTSHYVPAHPDVLSARV